VAELTFDQTDRRLKLELDGALSSSLIPVQFHGREGISELHSYIVDIVSSELSLSPDSILGHDVNVVLTFGGIERKFTGLVARFSPGPMWGSGRSFRSYQLELVPKLWLATLNARCRSFLNKSGTDIVQSVLSEYSASPSTRGSVTRDKREYCVQYCESDFNFLSRLLEQEGVFYYFGLDHKNNSIILVDGTSGTFSVDDADIKVGPDEWITDWSQEFRTVPQAVTFSGYDFKQFAVVTQTKQAAKKLNYASSAKIEAYSSNVMYEQRSEFFADKHMQLNEKDYETYRGASSHPNMAPGGRFKLADGNSPAAGQSVMVLEVQHYATCYTHIAGEGGAAEYSNHFVCCPLDTNYRPPYRAQIPVVYGPQTATVDGDPDEYGRVKVKYHWGSELQSWWARIAMPWAHKQMGFQFFPRDKSEVVIEFLDGNPERPIIVGAVYNGVNKVIYTLPDNKTQSGMRGTDPDQTGSDQGLNELQFEDKSGSEFINFFAKKDFKRVVVNDDSLEVRQGKRDVVIKQGNLTTTLEQGNEARELKQGNLSVKLDMGNQTTKLDLGSASTEAMQSIELKVGQNSITIDQTGVTIKGMMVNVQGQVQTQVKGAMVQISGDAMVQVSGGITMIG
jgi:type VI secretion system secreted protein VgrG